MKNTTPKSLANIWLQKIKENGQRLTHPRRVIVEIFLNSKRALEPIEVYDLGRKTYPKLGLVTVYRTLESMEKLGLLQKVHQSQGCNRYISATHGHQHLLICNSCGRVVYFEGFDLEQQFNQLGKKLGYHITDHWLQLFGTCHQCQSKSKIR